MSLWTPERIAELTRLRAAGLSYTRIGDRLGLSKNQCIGKARRLGITAHTPPPTRKPIPKRLATAYGNRPHVPLTAYTGTRQPGCKWPHPDYIQRIRAHAEPFCGEPTINESSWCLEHHRRVFARSA